MSDPLALLPLAIAAGKGRIGAAGEADQYDAQQLVAAGLTLLQRSAPLVRALAGRRSAILLPTMPAYLTALAASEGRGAVLVNPVASMPEIAYQCEDANVGAVFTISALAPRVPAGLPVVLLDDAPRTARVVTPDRTQDVDLGSHHGLAIEGERDVRGSDEEAVIVYTSAMQGRPLGAIVTHANILVNARSGIEAMGCTSDDVTLAFLPYSHLFGFTITAGTALLAGGQVRTMPRFHPGRVAKQFEEGVTVLVGVPSVFRAMLSEIVERGMKLRDTAIRLTVCGGAELPLELQERWFDATGFELRQGYGLTEAGPVCLFNRVDRPNVPGTLGHPFPNVDVAIMPPADYSHDAEREQPESRALPVGVAGEICVRGGLPRRGEWLCTGDQGVFNADGTVTFLGLVKPMFTRNAFNIYPREIERAVCELAGVRSAEVTPIPQRDRKADEIVPNEHDIRLRVTGDVTREQVAAWCESRLSAYKQPSEIEIVRSSEGESGL